MTVKTIFLDRDGVINKEKGYLYKIDDFEWIEGAKESIKYLNDHGYYVFVVTNQSGIARGYYSENDYQMLSNWMKNQFQTKNIDILDIFHCPHGPKSKCICRKPKPGMLLKALQKYDIDMEKSWLIGDKETDIICANKAGIFNTVLVKSGHKINESPSKAKFILGTILDSNKVITS